MRLLFITQKIDKNDTVLGFVHGWLSEFEKTDEVVAVCLEKGKVELSKTTVTSLGKEDGTSRVKYLWRFYKTIISKRGLYDGVFVHMNSEYVLLGAFLWRLWGKKIIIWYNHTDGNWRIRLAMKLADFVCHTSPFAYTAGTKKSRQMPAGINTDFFRKTDGLKKSRSILYLGRIAPVKNIETLIRAADILNKNGEGVTLSIYGSSIARDREYFESMKRLAEPLVQKGIAAFKGAIPNIEAPSVFSSHEVFVNLTPAGNYDKTVLEAMACESLPLVASSAFRDTIGDERFEFENNPESLARAIHSTLALGEVEKRDLGLRFRAAVVEKHNIESTVRSIHALYGETRVS